MSDREQRVLGAGEKIEVDGQEYRMRPISALHLVDLERDALAHYKRQYLQTFSQNADLLGEQAVPTLQREMERVARWDLDDLPRKNAFDVARVPITDGVRAWAEENQREANGEAAAELEDRTIRALLVTALDQERLTPEQVKEMSGKTPLQGKVRYDQWWVTASMEGMVSFIHSSIRCEHPRVTKESVASWPFAKISEASRLVERITSPDMGNTQGSLL